jgi:hypothetical protein
MTRRLCVRSCHGRCSDSSISRDRITDGRLIQYSNMSSSTGIPAMIEPSAV